MKTILLVVWVLLGFVNTFSQEKVILKSAFDQITKTSSEILKIKPFRMTVTSETRANGKPQKNTLSKTVIEVSADKRRFVNEKTSNEKTSKSEYIQIGGKAYSREDGGQWKETKVFERTPLAESLKIIDEQVEYKSLGTETLNNQTVNVYLKTSKSKRIDEANNNQEILSVESVKYWFDKDGALLKREMKRENRIGELVFNFHIISLFEYDSSIQISDPK